MLPLRFKIFLHIGFDKIRICISCTLIINGVIKITFHIPALVLSTLNFTKYNSEIGKFAKKQLATEVLSVVYLNYYKTF